MPKPILFCDICNNKNVINWLRFANQYQYQALKNFFSISIHKNFIKDVAAAVLSRRVNAASSSGGLRVGRGHHVSPRLLSYLYFFVPPTTIRSFCPPFGFGVRASATLGRPRVVNGPTCLSASRHLCSDPSRGSSLSCLSSLTVSSSFFSLFIEDWEDIIFQFDSWIKYVLVVL